MKTGMSPVGRESMSHMSHKWDWLYLTVTFVWRWQPMLKLMNEASLRNVVGTGITQVWCKPTRGFDDFRRHWVRRNEQKKS